MTRLKEAIRYNEEDCIALSGDGVSDGSRRLVVDSDTGNELIEKIVDGIWQPTSFETGPNSLWVGPNVGVAALGHHMATECADGHLHFHAHSEFVDGLSTTDTKIPFSYAYTEGIPIQPDESGEWSGTSLKFDITPQSHTLLDVLSIKTGAIAATKYVRLTVRTDNPDTGSIILNQKYPASYFTADTLVDLDLTGNIEFDAGVTFYFEYSSSETFSLKTNAAGDWPWAKISYSSVREDGLLQTKPWEDGGSWDSGDHFINGRKIYISNVTGEQPGTFEENSDKWDLIGNQYIVGKFTQYAIPIANADGKLTEAPTDLFYDALDYLHTPGLAVFNDDAILKRGHGLALISDEENEFDIVHINTQTKSAFFKYDPVADKFKFDKVLQVNGFDVLTSESDPAFTASPASGIAAQDITNWDTAYGWGDHSQAGYLTAEDDPAFSAWDKSSGISITESQISDLQDYLLSETDPVFSAWDKSTGISITESQISDLAHTPAFNGDITEIYNSAGLFKIQPDAQGDVEVFGDTNVDNADNGKIFKIWRQALEGNDYIRFYISAGRKAYIHASRELTLQAQNPFTINSVTEDIFFKVGDNAGVKKFHFRDSDNNDVVTIDSNGVMTLDKNNGAYLNLVRGTVNKISNFFDSTYTDLRFEGDKDYNRIGTWIDKPFQIVTNSIDRIIVDQYGRVVIPSSLTVSDLEATDDILAYGDISARNHDVRSAIVFNNKSTQIEAGERHFSQGHTHTAVYNGDWYDASSENISERDLHFSPDGLMMYVIGLASGGTGDCSIWEYSLTIPWDLSTVGTPTIESIEAYGSNQVGLFIDIDGRRLWTVCTNNDTVIEYSMSTWNISSLSWVQAKDISGQDSAPSAVFWSANGDRLFIAGDSDNDIVAFSITNEWDISGISWFEDFGTNIDAPTGLHFSSDGRRMYVMDGSAEDDIHEFHLSSPWMISSARLVNLFDVSAENASPQGIFIVPDNSKIFMVGTGTPDGVYGYDLGLEVEGLILADGGLTVGGIARMNNLPTSDPVSAGVLWNSSGAVMVSAG